MKKTILIITVLIIASLFMSCGGNESNKTDAPEASNMSNTELKQLTSGYYDYVKQYNISIVDFSSKVEKLDEWLDNPKGEGFESPVYLNGDDAIFSDKVKFKREQSGLYRYFGEMKDNYPDGIGVILKGSGSEFSDVVSSASYIGEFKKGYFDGFGIVFQQKQVTESMGIFEVDVTDSDSVAYLIYEGEFKDGLMQGKGNLVYENMIYSGELKKQEMEGYGKLFSNHYLLYDGDFENGKRDGEGREYFEDSQKIKYEGQFNNNLYDGKGTLYDSNGNIIYEGKWKNGEYK